MAEINKYNSSLIYTIRSHQTTKYYIGSTTQSLSRRLSEHIRDYKKYLKDNTKYISSCEILKYSDYYIELLLAYPCNNKDELHRREGELIRQHKSDLVNICIAGRTTKEYRVDNKTHLTEQHKQYIINNIVHIKEKEKQYRLDNKVLIAENNKKYRLDNKVSLTELRKQPIICECGTISNKGHISSHLRTNIHTININNLYLNELNYYIL